MRLSRIKIESIGLFILLFVTLIHVNIRFYTILKTLVILAFFAFFLLKSLFSKTCRQDFLVLLPHVLFGALCFLSILWAENRTGVEEQLSNVSLSIIIFSTFFLFLNKTKANFKDVAYVVGVFSLLYILYIFSSGGFGVDFRLASDTNSNTIGLYLSYFSIILLFYLKLVKKSYFLIFVLIANIVVIFLTGSRTATINVALSFIFVFVFGVYTKRIDKVILKVLISLLAVVSLFLILTQIPVFYNSIGRRLISALSFVSDSSGDASAFTRSNMKVDAFNYFLQKPLLGWGLNNFKYISRYETYSHSNFFELLACLGVLGFVLHYSQIIYVLFNSFKLWKTSKYMAIPLLICIIIIIDDYATVSYFSFGFQFILGFAVWAFIKKDKTKTRRRELVTQ